MNHFQTFCQLSEAKSMDFETYGRFYNTRGTRLIMSWHKHFSVQRRARHISASPIWCHVDWHLVWLSEHLTKTRGTSINCHWSRDLQSPLGGYQSFQPQINLGMKGDMYYADVYYAEWKRHTRVPLPFEFIGEWLLALSSGRARRKWLALQSAGQRARNKSKGSLNVKQTFIK